MSEIKNLINVAVNLVEVAKEVVCKQDKNYVKNSKLLEFYNDLPGVERLGKRNNRTTILQAIEEWIDTHTEDKSAIEQEVTEDKTATHQVVCTDHAYHNDKYVEFKGTEEQCKEYVERQNPADVEAGLVSYNIVASPTVPEEDTKEKNEKLTLPFNAKTCWVILSDVLSKASKNNWINFASCEMVRFTVTWRFFHKTVTVKGVDENGKEVRVPNPAITEEEREAVAEFIIKMVNHYGFLLNAKGTGYTIPCFLMAWHHRKVVYKFTPKKSNSNHYYELDYDTQKIAHKDVEGNLVSTVEFTKEVCKKIDNSCKFLRIVPEETQEQ